MYETHDHNSQTIGHCVTYGWHYRWIPLFAGDTLKHTLGIPGPHFGNHWSN